jgi:hypothetical protein
MILLKYENRGKTRRWGKAYPFRDFTLDMYPHFVKRYALTHPASALWNKSNILKIEMLTTPVKCELQYILVLVNYCSSFFITDLEGGWQEARRSPPPPFARNLHQMLVKLKIWDPNYVNILLFWGLPPPFLERPSLFEIFGSATDCA